MSFVSEDSMFSGASFVSESVVAVAAEFLESELPYQNLEAPEVTQKKNYSAILVLHL